VNESLRSEPEKARRAPRSDSLRNRDRLLRAARDVFAEGGAGASLEAVARRANLGIGTLYRHFPTREALFQAVYSKEIDELVALAGQLLAEPDPTDGLRHWLHANIGVIATKRGMVAALSPAPESSTTLYLDSRRRLVEAVGALMRRPQAEGAMRSDVTPEEVLQALQGIAYGRDDPGWQATALRLIDIFVDGLRIGPPP
jgi:AcrR family transcriptional regulator